ncbi:phage/plasmid primase, P4 family [Thermoactinomyces sp. CICC 10521]|uniref:phage/plasmid primase, P4 family n=1 Tax=Thermoactinomyces sp. CICC 10521 TaxID=2767426 RepID=UPI0018DB1B81|nr:phage/plasmid primase, P4 family [Thermoactinomyces sp. CICC 10521]MBH8609097.1 bifunctional DNA primase/polymerase [Thermoactinomyces sp. CICC 10521]
MQNKLEYALYYASLGWQVFPVHEMKDGICSCWKGAECEHPGKHPYWDSETLRKGRNDATDDIDLIRKWWKKWPNANIGIATGHESGLVVLDVDIKGGGFESLKEMIGQYGGLPETVKAITGSNGSHYFFNHPGIFMQSSQNKIAPGIDIRGDGGYVVAAPSNHKSGNFYRWENSPNDTQMADLPGWLLKKIQEGVTKKSEEARSQTNGRVWTKLVDGTEIPEGTRDDSLFRLGCWMRARGASFEDIYATLTAVNQKRVKPPLSDREVLKKAEQAAKYEPGKKESLLDYQDSDSGNAERLVARHGADIRYCIEKDVWLIWDGSKWAEDTHFEIYRRALDTVRAFGQETLEAYNRVVSDLMAQGVTDLKQNEEVKQAIKRINFARASESRHKLESMIGLARTIQGIPISVNDLDQNLHLINLKNGTFNLKEGKLYPHNRNDMITQIANISFDPKAKAPRWEKFIAEIMKNDPDKMDFLQKYAGYCLSGDTSEAKFPIAYGNGANGKSVFNNVLLHVFGDYGMQASSDLIMERKNQNSGAPNPELVQTRGKRLIIISETTDGNSLNEEFVKSATGNDIIRVRDLYGKPFSFRPVAKFILATNHKPLIRGTDDGIWRRLILIPFEEKFEGDRCDPYLEEKLIAEAPGILNWMIEGYKKWSKERLSPSESMVAATQEYRATMDSLGSFLEECCVLGATEKAGVTELHETYLKWCEESGEPFMNKRMFKKRLEERGYRQGKSGSNRFWVGIGIIDNFPIATNVVPFMGTKSNKMVEGEV